MSYLDALLTASAGVLALPAVVLGVECLVACLVPGPKRRKAEGTRPSIAVVVPAHNEENQIAGTLRSIQPQLAAGDRLIVVADNCTDRTAEIAESLGAEALVRHDLDRRGKGYAIRHALAALQASPPEIVVNIDADCTAEPGAIDQIARLAAETGRPVQGAYEMRSPIDGTARMSRVSEFAVRVKNRVRPLGLQKLGLPCLLTGSGMAFPWDALQRTPHPESHIVEDMRYSTDLAINGYPPRPCMQADFVAWLPSVDAAFVTQRTRWEHGHLATIRSEAPRLLGAFLRTGRLSLLALLLELVVPPLSLFVCFLAVIGLAAGLIGWFGGGWWPLIVLASCGSFAVAGLGVAWLRHGRDILPPRELLSLPGYVLKKLPIYRRFVVAPEEGWVRTARDAGAAGPHFGAPGGVPVVEKPSKADHQSS